MSVVAASIPILINNLKHRLDLWKMYPYKTRSYLFVAYIQNSLIGYM